MAIGNNSTQAIRHTSGQRPRTMLSVPPARGEATSARTAPQESAAEEHITKTGYPDRRFKGQRDLPAQEEVNNFRQPRNGEVIDGKHFTLDGKPDRRYSEWRGLNDAEANAIWLDEMNRRHGRSTRR